MYHYSTSALVISLYAFRDSLSKPVVLFQCISDGVILAVMGSREGKFYICKKLMFYSIELHLEYSNSVIETFSDFKLTVYYLS